MLNLYLICAIVVAVVILFYKLGVLDVPPGTVVVLSQRRIYETSPAATRVLRSGRHLLKPTEYIKKVLLPYTEYKDRVCFIPTGKITATLPVAKITTSDKYNIDIYLKIRFTVTNPEALVQDEAAFFGFVADFLEGYSKNCKNISSSDLIKTPPPYHGEKDKLAKGYGIEIDEVQMTSFDIVNGATIDAMGDAPSFGKQIMTQIEQYELDKKKFSTEGELLPLRKKYMEDMLVAEAGAIKVAYKTLKEDDAEFKMSDFLGYLSAQKRSFY